MLSKISVTSLRIRATRKGRIGDNGYVIIIRLIFEAQEINNLFEKIYREMYGKKRANSHYHHPEGSSNSKWHNGIRHYGNLMDLVLIFSGYIHST